ncbi:SNF2 family DNA or RNA helicase [Desulfitispora alkaliphila]|uniref:SNF2-related protein n=1 Tax=Desulfitispora alkaliphila TaxID=622674 RepID=UPI003D19F665
MIYEPYDYQEYATQWIIDKEKAALFLDMGMGKTACTLTAAAELLHDYFEVTRVLVVAPLRVAQSTWDEETAKWDHLKHLKISKVLGTEKERVSALNKTADIYIINRENVKWLVDRYKSSWPFDMVVIDELSSFKSHKAQRFKALRKVRPLMKRVVGLTGTPAPNGLIDLWPQVYLLDGGERLGKTITGYRDRYFLPDKRNQNVVFSYKPKEDAEEAIYKKLSDICVSMKAEDYLKLPERVNNTITVQLPEKPEEKYRQLERDLLLPLMDTDIVADTAAVLTNKLLQMANGAVYDEDGNVQEIHNEKLKALEDTIEAASGKPVLIFYSYKHDLKRIKEYLNNENVKELSKPEDIEDWNKGKVPVMLAHPASAGHGLNLQAGGNIIVWFGLTWSLELYQQANARLHRQGQKHSVIIHHLIAKGTVDEEVMKVLENKEAGQEALLNAVQARLEQVL